MLAVVAGVPCPVPGSGGLPLGLVTTGEEAPLAKSPAPPAAPAQAAGGDSRRVPGDGEEGEGDAAPLRGLGGVAAPCGGVAASAGPDPCMLVTAAASGCVFSSSEDGAIVQVASGQVLRRRMDNPAMCKGALEGTRSCERRRRSKPTEVEPCTRCNLHAKCASNEHTLRQSPRRRRQKQDPFILSAAVYTDSQLPVKKPVDLHKTCNISVVLLESDLCYPYALYTLLPSPAVSLRRLKSNAPLALHLYLRFSAQCHNGTHVQALASEQARAGSTWAGVERNREDHIVSPSSRGRFQNQQMPSSVSVKALEVRLFVAGYFVG